MSLIFKDPLGFYAAENGSFLLKFRDRIENWTDKLSQNVGKELPFYRVKSQKNADLRYVYILQSAQTASGAHRG